MNRRSVRRPSREEIRRRRAWARLVAELEAQLQALVRRWMPELRDALPRRVDLELKGVHRTLQAHLLRGAAELRLAREADGRLWTAPQAPFDGAAWRSAAREEVALALADRRAIDPQLLACRLLPVASWPPAEVLARAARRLVAGATADLLLARARFAAGHRDEAQQRYRVLARGVARFDPRLHEARAAAAEARGDREAAIDANLIARALGAGWRAEATAFVHACVLGDRALATRLAEELEANERDGRSAVRDRRRAARELAGRWRSRGVVPRPAPDLESFVVDCVCCGERGLADLCWSLLS